jgi:hypothetical protein
MSNFNTVCLICGHEEDVDSYFDYVCGKCGQPYEYEEGHMISLTSEQVALLRQNNPASRR